MTLGRVGRAAIGALAVALGAPAAASAETVVSKVGTTMVVQGGPGDRSEMVVLYSTTENEHSVTEFANVASATPPDCTRFLFTVTCTGITAIRVLAGDRDDSISLEPLGTAESPRLPVEILGEEGDDVVRGGTRGVTIDGGAGEDTLLGSDGNDVLLGGADADFLRGKGGNDRIEVGPGADVVRGGEGDDSVQGDLGPNVVRGEGGNDLLLGGIGPDDLHGDGGRDRLFGGPGPDFLSGDGANDLLRGDRGLDILLGGSGVDRLNARDRGRDRVIDCGKGKDPAAKRDRRRDPRARSCGRFGWGGPARSAAVWVAILRP